MRVLLLVLAFTYPSCVAAQGRGAPDGRSGTIQPEAWQIVQLANQARAAAGAGPLTWDPALSAAARQHCLRMAAEGPISHRYGGEPDLDQRAGQAGAHFSLIEENVAVGPTPARIHEEWMNSPTTAPICSTPRLTTWESPWSPAGAFSMPSPISSAPSPFLRRLRWKPPSPSSFAASARLCETIPPRPAPTAPWARPKKNSSHAGFRHALAGSRPDHPSKAVSRQASLGRI